MTIDNENLDAYIAQETERYVRGYVAEVGRVPGPILQRIIAQRVAERAAHYYEDQLVQPCEETPGDEAAALRNLQEELRRRDLQEALRKRYLAAKRKAIRFRLWIFAPLTTTFAAVAVYNLWIGHTQTANIFAGAVLGLIAVLVFGIIKDWPRKD